MTDEQADSVGEYLRKSREQAKLSLRDLENLSGVSFAHIRRIEQGENIPSVDVLQKLVEPLKLNIDELLAKFGIKLPLPEPRVYFRRKFGVSEEDAEVMERLIEKYRIKGGSENGEDIEE